MGKIIKKVSKKKTSKPEEIKPKPDEPKAEFTFEATGKKKEEFDKAEKVIKGVEATSLLFLRSEWLVKLLKKGKKIFPFLKVIKLKKIEESVVSFFTICIRLFSIATATFLIVASLRGIFNETYSIEPLKVPESFVQDGLDGQEVSSRLLQSVQEIVSIAKKEPKIKYDFNKEIAQEDVVIMGVSLNSIKQLVRSSMGIQNKTITGGIIKREKELEISLRVSGLKKSFTSIIVPFEEGKLYKAFDILMIRSAIQLLEKTEPIVAFSYFINGNNYDKAKNIALSLIESEAEEEKLYGYLAKGYLFSQEKEYNKAIEQYKKAIELNPKFALTYNESGNTLFALGNKKEAIESYKKAIDLNPKDAIAFFNLGIASSASGNKKEAIESYKKAIALNPKNADFYYSLGNALVDLGNRKEATENYKKAIDLNQNHADAYNNLGVTLFELDDKKGAIEQYKKAIELDPNHAIAYANLGYVFFKLGDKKEAIEQFQKAIKLDPIATLDSFCSDISNSIKVDGDVTKEREIFYEFLELSLKNKIEINIKTKPYSFYSKEKQFKDLMKRYSTKK